jgi:beta-galactosidase/beta-glucuronidase
LEIDDPQLWTPETPHLYRFTLQSGDDLVHSYFALREIGIGEKDGQKVLSLNGAPYFFHGLLDQGYFPDGLFLPATAQGYQDDILRAKELGFNMLRKHIKIEPAIFYYYCDLYGMAVFQDMVNNGRYHFIYDTALPTVGLKNLPKRQSARVREIFSQTAHGTLSHLHNFPCIVYYTIFNEGWGQHAVTEVYESLKNADPTRIYDSASGWFGRDPSDVQSEHVYFKKAKFPLRADRPVILSEFGGYSCNIEEHSFNLERVYGYKICKTPADLTADLAHLYRTEVLPLAKRGMSGAVLTQLCDVEDETNGLITYDRKVVKVDSSVMQAIASELRDAFEK